MPPIAVPRVGQGGNGIGGQPEGEADNIIEFPVPEVEKEDVAAAAGTLTAGAIAWRLAIGLLDGPQPGPLDVLLWGSLAF